MKHAVCYVIASVLTSFAVAGTANARYLCDDPPAPLDKRACAAAAEGPQALRRFIDRMRPIESLYFYDYVNHARLLAWDDGDKRSRALAEASKPAAEQSPAEVRR